MQIDMQVSEVYANELIKQFNQCMSGRISPEDLQVEIVRPPLGTMGAEDTRTVRVKASGLGTAAQIAALLGLCLSAYVGLFKESHECVVKVTTKQGTTEAIFPCRDDPQGLMELLKQHIGKHGMPEKVQVKHVRAKK